MCAISNYEKTNARKTATFVLYRKVSKAVSADTRPALPSSGSVKKGNYRSGQCLPEKNAGSLASFLTRLKCLTQSTDIDDWELRVNGLNISSEDDIYELFWQAEKGFING